MACFYSAKTANRKPIHISTVSILK